HHEPVGDRPADQPRDHGCAPDDAGIGIPDMLEDLEEGGEALVLDAGGIAMPGMALLPSSAGREVGGEDSGWAGLSPLVPSRCNAPDKLASESIKNWPEVTTRSPPCRPARIWVMPLEERPVRTRT